MSYSEQIFNQAKDIMQKKRSAAERKQEDRRYELIKECPELITLEKELAATGQAVIKALDLDSPEEVKTYITSLREKNLAIQADIAKILETLKLPKNHLEVHYECPECNDTGVQNGRLCSCFVTLMRNLAYDELCKSSPLKISGFKDFSLSYYPSKADEQSGVSARKRMSEVLDFCREYASDFSKHSPSLFLYGETGLGKTHLSLSIASEVINKGYGVVYGSAQNLISRIEDEHFGRRVATGTSSEIHLIECDLLILDDLGAEFCTQFTVSVIYNIINSRILSGLPTIINSNLSLPELEAKYTARITSRIVGEYRHLRFFGRDIRQIRD